MATIAYLIAERDFHAYVDRHLDKRRRKAVEAYLARHAALAATVAAYRAQNAALAAIQGAQSSMPEQIRKLCQELSRRLAEPPSGSQSPDGSMPNRVSAARRR
jgi:anti-sigma factor RsiW